MRIKNFKNNKFANVSNESVGMIETDHLMVHQGKSFLYTRKDTLSNNEVVNIGIYLSNPLKACHLLHLVHGISEYTIYLYEDAVYTGGSPLPPKNRNRIYKTTLADTALVLAPTITDEGTLLHSDNIGSGNQTGGDSRENNEWILAPETYYLLRVISNSNTNLITQIIEFYENLLENL